MRKLMIVIISILIVGCTALGIVGYPSLTLYD